MEEINKYFFNTNKIFERMSYQEAREVNTFFFHSGISRSNIRMDRFYITDLLIWPSVVDLLFIELPGTDLKYK